MEELVLIVEDEQDVRLTLERTLQRGGYRTKAVPTAARCCKLRGEQPDRRGITL